jgi:hypothetical protein
LPEPAHTIGWRLPGVWLMAFRCDGVKFMAAWSDGGKLEKGRHCDCGCCG